MNLKRALGIGLVLYIVTFLIGVILTIIARTIQLQSQIAYWIITIVVTVLPTSLASLWYFKGKNAQRNSKEGLKLGVMFVIIGLILDLMFFIPILFKSGGAAVIIGYYKEPSFYFTMLLVIVTSIFIGSRNEKEKRENSKPAKKK